MYKCFKENFHVDLEARCEGYNLKQVKRKDKLSVIKYAELFGYIDDLYSCCTKLFEAEIDEVLTRLTQYIVNKIHERSSFISFDAILLLFLLCIGRK